MRRFSQLKVLVLSVVGLTACHAPPAPPPAPVVESTTPGARLNSLLERYWSETFPRPGLQVPDISAQALADSLAAQRRYLADVIAIPRAALDSDARETYDIFLRDRQVAIEGFTFPTELLPLNPYDSEPQRLALAAASGRVDDWHGAADAFAGWSAQAILNMKDGLRRGYTLPRPTAERMVPWLAALGADSPANPFFKIAEKPKILAAYRALHDFLQQEYLPRTRTSIGMSALPLGDSWYAYLLRRETGSEMNAKAVHDLGVAESERLRGRLQALLAGTAYAGNVPGFLDNMRRDPRSTPRSADALLMAYEELTAQVGQTLPSVVAEAAAADFDIRPVEPYAQAFAPPLSYWQPPPGSKAGGILYANTADLDARPPGAPAARFLGEALPGRDLQLSVQEERVSLPKYRRFLGSPAFIEGWKLYAVSLGDELGVYRDTDAKAGALLVEMECAGTLVVDSGLHGLGWSREQALDYLRAQLPIEDAQAARVVDVSIALPGHGLGCSAAAQFHALRAKAEKFLGARFNLAAFNAALIEEGAVPMDLLESRMKHWQEAQAATAAAAAAAASGNDVR